jgi:hypothetical protein
MTEKIRSAIEAFSKDSGAGRRALRSMLEEDPENFLRTSVGMLGSEADSPGLQQLLRLLAGSEPAMRRICDPEFLRAEQSVALARRVAQVDPQFDSMLLRMLPRPEAMLGSPSAIATAERVLSLIEATASRRELSRPWRTCCTIPIRVFGPRPR